MTRRFAWRTHGYLGKHLLDQRFDSPADAGLWRREMFPASDGPAKAPLTLVAVTDAGVQSPTALELFDCHNAWLYEAA